MKPCTWTLLCTLELVNLEIRSIYHQYNLIYSQVKLLGKQNLFAMENYLDAYVVFTSILTAKNKYLKSLLFLL